MNSFEKKIDVAVSVLMIIGIFAFMLYAQDDSPGGFSFSTFYERAAADAREVHEGLRERFNAG